jgi:hypothetical protein
VKRVLPLLAVVALLAAGCGGSKSSAPPVAGSQTSAQFLSPTFKGSANAIARQLSAQVSALQKNLEANAEIGSSLQKSNCTGTVNTQLTQRAHSQQEKQIAKSLAGACGDLTRALQSAHAGDKAKARQFAAKALSQAKLAASASH